MNHLIEMCAAIPGRIYLSLKKLFTYCVRCYWLRKFSHAGKRISIGEGVQIHGAEHIYIEDDVAIANRVTLRAMTGYPWSLPPQTFRPHIHLKRGCFINNGTHIASAQNIVVGEDVMIAENCFIADNNHAYTDPERAVKCQPLRVEGKIEIGDGSWIGANTVIVGNVNIGKHSIIAAHSVVNCDIPGFVVAAGIPAKVIKKYDPQNRTWIRAGKEAQT